MGLFDILKPLCSVRSIAVNKSQQHKEKNYWECRESNLGLPVVKREHCPSCYAVPFSASLFVSLNGSAGDTDLDRLAYSSHLVGLFSNTAQVS